MARRLILFTGCLVLFFFANFTHAWGQDDTSEPLVSSVILKQAGLKRLWQEKLPLEKNEKVSKIHVTDKLLYVSTDKNYFYAIDRKEGTIKLISQPAAAKQPLLGPTFYDGKLLFMVGKKLLIMDPALKGIIKSKLFGTLADVAVSAPVRNTDFFYIASDDKKLYALSSEDYLRQFAVSADNDSMINSIIADDEFLIVSTDAGNIIRFDPKGPDCIWRRDVGGIKAPLKTDGKWLYVSTTNAKVSKINMETSQNGWLMDFVAGEKLTTPVTIGNQLIYQYAGKKGLYAIGKQTGRKLWQIPNGIGLMAESGSIAYVFEKPGRLTVMDNKKPAKLFSVNLANVDIFAINTIDEKIFLSDYNGRIMAIGTRE